MCSVSAVSFLKQNIKTVKSNETLLLRLRKENYLERSVDLSTKRNATFCHRTSSSNWYKVELVVM